MAPDTRDPDIRAANRAQWHVRNGHMQKAARVLHSTADMADLRQAEVQQAIAQLHPALPSTSVIPLLPNDCPQQLPDTRPICNVSGSILADPWHFLTCRPLFRGRNVNARHDEVGRALYRCALAMGLRAQLKPRGLDPNSDLRPDLLLTLLGRPILTDVAVVHPLSRAAMQKACAQLGKAKAMKRIKSRKYSAIASSRGFEGLPFVVETSGGFGPSAVKLIHAMARRVRSTWQCGRERTSCANWWAQSPWRCSVAGSWRISMAPTAACMQ